jgi:hypothetical protein
LIESGIDANIGKEKSEIARLCFYHHQFVTFYNSGSHNKLIVDITKKSHVGRFDEVFHDSHLVTYLAALQSGVVIVGTAAY